MRIASAVYVGRLRHRRFSPTEHEFEYPVSMLYLDLDEIEEIFSGPFLSSGRRPAPWWFRRKDFLGPVNLSLRGAVESRINRYHSESGTGATRAHFNGPIRLMTTVRNIGLSFNPISVYHCFDSTGRGVDTVVAEVTNTPWHRRHSYVIPVQTDSGSASIQHRFVKKLHVSPFNPMSIEYRWRSTVPAERAVIHMDARTVLSPSRAVPSGCDPEHSDHSPFFDATLNLERTTDTLDEIRRSMFRRPLSSWSTVFRIYSEAFRLWRKGVPVHDNPHVSHQAR